MPCVLTDVASSWPCVGGDARWTLEHFKRAHGNLDVVVDDGTREKLRTSMAEYVDAFDAMADRAEAAAAEAAGSGDASDATPPYLRTWNFYDDVPGMLDGFPADSPYFRDYFKTLKEEWQPPFTWLFLGPRGARTRLHVDVWHTDAWLTMIEGRKKFIMYHPAHLKHVFDERTQTYVDLHAPDLEKFPDFARAVPVEFILEEGETVYIPRKFPHYAVALTHTVSLTVNFLASANRRNVVERCVAYANRRSACEFVLGRQLKASDNVMKFCVHGGDINKTMAASILGLSAEELEGKMREKKRELLRREAAEAEREEEAA